MRKIIMSLLGIASMAGIIWAAGISGITVNETGLAYNKNYVYDLVGGGVTNMSAIAVYSSATIPSGTFSTGAVSVGSLTIVSNSILSGTTFVIGGFRFQAGIDYAVGGSAGASATNLANKINAVVGLGVAATPSSNVVALQSSLAGSRYNYAMTTSNVSALSISGVAMTGGIVPGWLVNTKNITIASNGFTLALPVLYSIGAAPAITGLTDQTTYYAIPVDANTLQLASSSANAQAGTAIVLASASALTSAVSYTLAPLAFVSGANTGLYWQVSNDNVNWTTLNVATVSWNSGGGAGKTSWAFGPVGYRYLELSAIAPSTGGLTLEVSTLGTN